MYGEREAAAKPPPPVPPPRQDTASFRPQRSGGRNLIINTFYIVSLNKVKIRLLSCATATSQRGGNSLTFVTLYIHYKTDNMSNRKKIEKAIVKEISTKVSQLNFKLVDKELNGFEVVQDNLKWGFSFYLTNQSIYSLFCQATVTYIDLSQIINSLLLDTEWHDAFSSGVGITDNDLKITQESESLQISDLEEVDCLSNLFFARILKIKELFWIPQSDPTSQMESFKKPLVVHWVNGSFIQNVLLWISIGIKESNIEKIVYGLNRGYNHISEVERLYGKNYQLGQNKQLLDILSIKLAEKGYR